MNVKKFALSRMVVITAMMAVIVGTLPMPAGSAASQAKFGCDVERDGSCCACGRDFDGYYCHPGAIYGIQFCYESEPNDPWPRRPCPRIGCNDSFSVE